MSWSFSLALVEEFKQQGCLVTASYARLKEIRTVEKSLWLARKTSRGRTSRMILSVSGHRFLSSSAPWSFPALLKG